jgi:hypothetical protein
MEERPLVVSGLVERAALDDGSKSERAAIVLVADDGQRYTLRLRDEPAFGASGLDDLVGTRIQTEGVAIDRTLFIKGWVVE